MNKNILELLEESHGPSKIRHKRMAENHKRKDGVLDPLHGLMMESGLLLDDFQGDHKDIYSENFENAPEDKKEKGHVSYHSLLQSLMPLIFDGVVSFDASNLLRRNKKHLKSHLKDHIHRSDILDLSPHMVEKTPHKKEHFDDALKYILENTVDSFILEEGS